MLFVAVAASLAGIGALVYLGARPGPERLPPDTDLGALLADYGCPGCNVLLVTVDTLRADHLPCQGYHEDTAPEICAFGERNLLFENAVSGAPSTLPALFSLLSGSIIANEDPGELVAHYERQPLLVEELEARGYLTAGFTDFAAIGGEAQRIERADFLIEEFDSFVNVGRGRTTRTSAELTRSILDWLEEHRDEQFFVWAHYADTRWNYVPPLGLARRFGYDERRCEKIGIGIDLQDARKIEKALTNYEVDCLTAMHQGEIFGTDRHLGRLLRRIDRLGLGERTLVVVSAAHGEEFLDRDRLGNEWTVYEELMHVPLMIRNPRRPVTGRLRQPISTASVQRIVLGAVDDRPIELPDDVVGRAYHYYGAEVADLDEVRRRPNEFALYLGRMKLIMTPRTGRYELFDLAADPRERHNLGVKQAKASPLYGRLRRWLEAHTVSPGPPAAAGSEASRGRSR